eukprot:5743847-Pyramimonas_sp.AAC.1
MDKPGIPLAPSLTPEEAPKRADGAWKNASRRHDQAVSQVVKCREALKRAEDKESIMAKEVAAAEINKKLAVQALARAAGMTAAEADSAKHDQKAAPWQLQWGEDFFNHIDDYECEQSEKDELLKLHAELVSARESLTAKGTQVEEWKQRALRMQKDVTTRLAKKRKGAEGQAAPGDGGAGAGDGAGASSGAASGSTGGPVEPSQKAASAGPTAEDIEKEAARISEAKFAAQAAAAAATAAAAQPAASA